MPKKSKNKEINSLAKEILKENKQIVDNDNFATFEKSERKIVKPTIEPILLTIGNSPNNPYVVVKTEREIYSFIESVFGSNEGDYFILNENTKTIHGNKKMKMLLVEDKNNFRYILCFDITKLSYLFHY